jgi:hypothetical protein
MTPKARAKAVLPPVHSEARHEKVSRALANRGVFGRRMAGPIFLFRCQK